MSKDKILNRALDFYFQIEDLENAIRELKGDRNRIIGEMLESQSHPFDLDHDDTHVVVKGGRCFEVVIDFDCNYPTADIKEVLADEVTVL